MSHHPSHLGLRLTDLTAVAALLTLLTAFVAPLSAQSSGDRRLERVDGPRPTAESPTLGDYDEEGERIALVIGNNDYDGAPLVNAVNDARAMGQVLRDAGFILEVVENVDLLALEQVADRFVRRVGPGDVALFYFSGHGFQIDGQNLLIPIGFQAEDEIVAKHRAFPVDLLRQRMERAGAQLQIMILDACRDNPFRSARGLGGGLAAMEGGRGTFIAFATAPGKTAADIARSSGRPGLGLFTGHLVEALEQPGLDLGEIFDRVRQRVDADSGQRQTPWTQSSVIGDFYFWPPEPRYQTPEYQAPAYQEPYDEPRRADHDSPRPDVQLTRRQAVLDVIEQELGNLHLREPRLHLHPNIPYGKRRRVAELHGVDPEDILLLYDDGIARRGKTGFFITEDAIHSREMALSSPKVTPFWDIDFVELEPFGFCVNDRQVTTVMAQDSDYATEVFVRLVEALWATFGH